MSKPEDADLILRFYELRRESRLREARSFLLGRFRAKNLQELNDLCPPGSEENAYFRQVLTYWDMVSAIVKRESYLKQKAPGYVEALRERLNG